MKKLLCLLVFIPMLVFIHAEGQINVNEGDNLRQAILDAPDGAEIIIKPGIHAAGFQNIPIDKSITLRGEGRNPKPLVYIKEFGISGSGINITFENIEFSGASYDTLLAIEDTVTLAGDYLLNLTDTFASGGEFLIKDCIIRNLTRCVIRGDRADNHVDKILIDDCIIYDFRGGSSYGPFRLKSRITFNEFTIKNSTMHHIPGTLIDCKDMVSHPATILIDHCTFHEWGGKIDNKYLFEITVNNQANLVIRNSILSKTRNTDDILLYGFRVLDAAYYEMGFSVMTPDFSVDDSTYAQVNWDKTEYNYENYTVNFLDPSISDFTIPHPDDLYEMSNEGTLIGDPRWSALVDPSDVGNILGSEQFLVYPVPARNEVYLMNGGAGIVEVFNTLGMKVDEIRLRNASIHMLDVSAYQKGLYILRLNNNIIRKIVVE